MLGAKILFGMLDEYRNIELCVTVFCEFGVCGISPSPDGQRFV